MRRQQSQNFKVGEIVILARNEYVRDLQFDAETGHKLLTGVRISEVHYVPIDEIKNHQTIYLEGTDEMFSEEWLKRKVTKELNES